MDQRHHLGKRSAAIIGALIAIVALGVSSPMSSAFASGAAEEKSPAKMLGLSDPNALEHFQLQPFNISVIQNGRVARIITLTVALETKGDANKTKIMAGRYYLQDAFLRDMHGFASYKRADGQALDPQMLKTRLLVISDRVLGENVVENVLVQSIFDRALP